MDGFDMKRKDDGGNQNDENVKKPESSECLQPRNIPTLKVDSDEDLSKCLETTTCDDRDEQSSNDHNSNDGTKVSSDSPSSSDSSTKRSDLLFPTISMEKQQRGPKRIVRSASLKSKKTLPDSREKKIVHFADTLGLDLEDVRHFRKDVLPEISKSAFADLKISRSNSLLSDSSDKIYSDSSHFDRLVFVPTFQQPGADSKFLERVQQQKVCLENTLIFGLFVTGVIRVLNMGFEKLVQVRYSTNDWKSHTELTADFVPPAPSDGLSDRFKFDLNIRSISPGEELSFAVKYVMKGQEFWDNNFGRNYVLQCIKKDH